MNDQNYVITQYAPGSRVYCDVDFNFEKSALEVFRYQSAHCPVYNEFLQSFERNFDDMTNIAAIPFLPIEAFKYHEVQTGLWHAAQIFRSSGTQGRVRAQHLVKNVEDYLRHTIHLFSNVFGELSQFQVMALLPNYLEAGDSSLVAMVRGFMHSAGQEKEMFFLHDFESLQKEILKCSQINQPILLFGVTFALLDFASAFPTALPPDSLLVETGGMKGRGQELNRNELHQFLSKQFSVPYVYSEYGMTELMSQAYTRRGDRYIEPPKYACRHERDQ